MSASWTTLPPEFLGDVRPDAAADHTINELLDGIAAAAHGESYLAWTRYQAAWQLYERLVLGREHTDGFIQDGFADCAARVAKTLALPRYKAEAILTTSISLHEMPHVADCLRDGIITDANAQLIASRTDLVGEATFNNPTRTPDQPADPNTGPDTPETDPTPTPDPTSDADPTSDPAPTPERSPADIVADLIADVSTDIAAALRGKPGTWSRTRLRDMVDRIIFRHDPDSVRERRQRALDNRGMWTEDRQNGTSELSTVTSTENAKIMAAAIRTLADTACKKDGRNRQQRSSDAHFAIITRTPFECQCGTDDCPADIPDPDTLPTVTSKVIIHVVCDEATLDGTAANAAYLDGHGVISDEHLRDLAARPDAVITPLVPQGTPMNPDGTFTLPTHRPSDPYRPSTALDTFIRVRDAYCTDPGCERSAWNADIDHVAEYNHDDPETGGQTTPDNLNSKCRPDHLLKTYGDWVDDQYRDQSGRLRTEYITPEGHVIPGEAETMEDFFPGLRRIRFSAPATAPPHRTTRSRPEPLDNPTRRRTRLANKHARRSAERHRNHKRRHSGEPPPF